MHHQRQEFLRRAIHVLERLRDESDALGYPLFASLLDLARAEAEDDLKTDALERQFAAGLKHSVVNELETELGREIAHLKRS